MRKEDFKNKWNQIKDSIKKKWNKLTDQDLNHINGQREHLISKLQERYHWDRNRAEEEVDNLEGRKEKEPSGFHKSEQSPRYKGEREKKTEEYEREYFKNAEEQRREQDEDEGEEDQKRRRKI
jgi:uncharacterized protein YjbJ (UPF0337 family)